MALGHVFRHELRQVFELELGQISLGPYTDLDMDSGLGSGSPVDHGRNLDMDSGLGSGSPMDSGLDSGTGLGSDLDNGIALGSGAAVGSGLDTK